MKSLTDNFGRTHRDLRVSLTDRCSLRCQYCIPSDFASWIPANELLTTKELLLVISEAVRNGITGIRLTGGEPLLHPDIVQIVREISELPSSPSISLTTNGIKLNELAAPLADAGLVRVNISLDTLSRETFKRLTFRDRIDDVFRGIRAAKLAGLSPIKINTVLMRGVNDGEATSLLEWALSEGLSLRFIEQMPLDAAGLWDRKTMISADEIVALLSEKFELSSVELRGSSPAEEFYVDRTRATVGIIGSVTRPFCGACDRLRLTSDGQLRSCLFAIDEIDIRKVLRNNQLDEKSIRDQISSCFERTVKSKLAGHGINEPLFISPPRPMSAIGG
jgi:GTP 3',8-cyclase